MQNAVNLRISGKAVLLSFSVVVIVFLVTHVLRFPGSLAYLLEINGGQPILDLKPSFSASEVYERLSDFGEAGRAGYRRMVITVDVVFPAALFLFLYLSSRYVRQIVKPNPFLGALLLLAPFGFLVSDIIENWSIYVILGDFPERHDDLAGALGYFTVLKRGSLYLALGLPLLLLVAARARRLSSRK